MNGLEGLQTSRYGFIPVPKEISDKTEQTIGGVKSCLLELGVVNSLIMVRSMKSGKEIVVSKNGGISYVKK